MAKQHPKKNPLKHALIFVTAGVLVVAGVLAGLELTNTTPLFHEPRPESKKIVTVGKPATPSQPTTSGSSRPNKQDIDAPATQPAGGATDTHGTAAPDTDPSKWVTSDTGYVTVKSPAANGKLQDGAVLAGIAKVDSVNYRLTDNAVGVIAQGQLAVSDGKFSGTLHFHPKGTGARLDVFSTDAGGTEYNEIQINVGL